MTWRRGLTLLAGLTLAREARAGPALLQADHLEIQDRVATGEGAVRVELDDQVATGARFRYELDTGLVRVESGTWTRPEGVLSFEVADIDLGGGQGVVLEGSWRGQDGRLSVEGDTLRWVGPGQLEGERVRFTTCTCERPPWSVEAREVRVTLDEVASFTGGWISLCELKLIPVPAGQLSLADRRSGLLLPRVGFGEDGLLLGLPLYLTMGPAADLTLTPELRSARSLRVASELRYALPGEQGGSLGAAGGWDLQTETLRGALSLDHRQARGPLRLGADALLWSDADYGADYGDSFLARQASWSESLLHAGLGPLRLESDTFQADAALGQRPLGLFLGTAAPLGPVSARAEARLDRISSGAGPTTLEGGASRARALVRLSAGRDLDLLHVESTLSSRASAWLDDGHGLEGARGEGRLALESSLPLWARSGSAYLLYDAGLYAEGALGAGEADPRDEDPDWGPALALGPVLRFRRVAAAGVPVSGVVRLPWTPDGLQPEGEIRLAAGSWQLRAQGDTTLQEGALVWDDGRLRLGIGAAHQPTLAQGRAEIAWTLPGPLSAFRPSWRGLVDADEVALISQSVGLRYRPACDCVELELSAADSEDRRLPELGLRLDIW